MATIFTFHDRPGGGIDVKAVVGVSPQCPPPQIIGTIYDHLGLNPALILYKPFGVIGLGKLLELIHQRTYLKPEEREELIETAARRVYRELSPCGKDRDAEMIHDRILPFMRLTVEEVRQACYRRGIPLKGAPAPGDPAPAPANQS